MLVWIAQANFEPGGLLLSVDTNNQPEDPENGTTLERIQQCLSLRNSVKVDNSFNQACYATLTVWFVRKYCPAAITTDFKIYFILPALARLYNSGETQDLRGQNDSTPKNDVLQWLHLSCMLLLCQENFGLDSNGHDIDGFAASELNRQDISKSQERCEKSITRLRKGKSEMYSSEEEEVDRLFLMGEELGFQALRPASSSLITARAKSTRAKIAERKSTTRFNAGPRPSKFGDTARVVSNAPWELTCLNHHTLLRTTFDRSIEISIQICRDACFEFLFSDYSFMSSWDRADKTMIESWWNFETGSVVCATLLDLKTAGQISGYWDDLRMQS